MELKLLLSGCVETAVNGISPNTLLYYYSNGSVDVDVDADAWRRKAVRPE